jgi:hypothetical protein
VDNGKYPHKSGELATAAKHGFYSLKKALNRKINLRTSLGKALVRWREELIEDLGGEKKVTAQQYALIDLAARNKLLVDSIDAWIFEQPSLILKRKRALLPVVKERQAIADGLAKYLGMLGLERKSSELDLARRLMVEGK